MLDCKHYQKYRDDFIGEIIDKRGSYMACLCYLSTQRNRVAHESIPIMLGSYIDFRIRGAKAVLEDRAQWGTVILKGLLKMYSNFSTFDSLSMHVRQTRTQKSIDWYMYVNGSGVALSYNSSCVNWTYCRETSTTDGWVSLLNEANPFKTQVLQSEYIDMFNVVLRYPYSMNDLKNRQILNGPTVMRRYIAYDLNRRKKSKTASGQKLSTAFEVGALFQALSKKNTFETEDWCKNYPQTYDNTLHEGRSSKTAHLLPSVIRASNAAVRNSNALTFPTDAIGYFCMLNTKDLKSAGEQNVLADFVIMCEETDQLNLFNHLTLKYGKTDGPNILTINGFLINCRTTWSLNDLVDLKINFPFVTTQYNLPYVRISTRPSIPIKYSEQHDCFFSPAETTHFQIVYPEADMFSITTKELTLESLVKTPPSKSTVSINNIKGSVAKVTSPFHKLIMQNSLGVTCYMDTSDAEIAAQIDDAIMARDQDTSIFEQYYETLSKEFELDQPIKINATNPKSAMKALLRMYPPKDLLHEYKMSNNNSPFMQTCCYGNTKPIQDYMHIIFNMDNYQSAPVWNLRLMAAFGNPHGACIEDGVVIDSKTLAKLPPVYYNACITVEFTFKTMKQPHSARFLSVNEMQSDPETARLLTSTTDETLLGCLITEIQVYVKHSKHTRIMMSKIGEHYFYLINFLPKKTGVYDNVCIKHIRKNHIITVVITGQKRINIGVGSKIANAFGQKNIISLATDLSDCWGVTRDGRKMHAQIIYSEVSMISRVTSGQLYSMFQSPDLAIGPNGVFIAPINLVVHTLHPFTNVKVTKVKNDTLTAINGFDSQNLSCTSHSLRTESVQSRIMQTLGLHGFNVDFVREPEMKAIVCESSTPPAGGGLVINTTSLPMGKIVLLSEKIGLSYKVFFVLDYENAVIIDDTTMDSDNDDYACIGLDVECDDNDIIENEKDDDDDDNDIEDDDDDCNDVE